MLPSIIAKLLDPIGWLIMVTSLYFLRIFIKKWWVIFLASFVGAILGEILLSKIAGLTYETGREFIPLFLAGIIQCSVAFVFANRKKKENDNKNEGQAYFAFINVEIESGESELKATPPKSHSEVSEAFEKIVQKFEAEDILIAKTTESRMPGIDKEVIGKKGDLLIFALTSGQPITSMDTYLSYIREHLASLSAVDDFMENSDKYL